MARGLSVGEIRRQFQAVKERFSPEALGKMIAQQASALAREVEDGHRQQVGTTFPRTQIVDGVIGGSLDSGRRVIVFRWSITPFVVRWVIDELRRRSPVLTGKYRDSYRLMINGQEVDRANFQQFGPDDEIAIASLLPYSRKIEIGRSRMAPQGVYEVTAEAARIKFGRGRQAAVEIEFTYREYAGYDAGLPGRVKSGSDKRRRKTKSTSAAQRRFPTIIIRPRSP